MNTSNKIDGISDLLTGSGAEDFKAIEQLSDTFCPFEAIGMVTQEIRHSTFLSFILDANRPHEFGSKVLYELLGLIAEQSEFARLNFSSLDLHFMDIAESSVLREWKNIDLVIELPGASYGGKKKTVIAIELKIHASEHGNQLERYRETILSKYNSVKWNHLFVFLTLNEDNTESKYWIPVSLPKFIARLECILTKNNLNGQSANLLRSYILMVRKNLMPDERLEELVRKVWAKHKEALDVIIQYKPNPEKDLKAIVFEKREEIALDVSNSVGRSITSEKSSLNIIRFAVSDWDNYAKMNSGEANNLISNKIFILEMTWDNTNNLEISYVLWPGCEQTRMNIFNSVKKYEENEDVDLIVRGSKDTLNIYQHLSNQTIFHKDLSIRYFEGKMSAEDVIKDIIKNFEEFLNSTIQKYDKILNEALT